MRSSVRYQKIDSEKIALLIGLPLSIIELAHPLKEVGEHSIALQHDKVTATALVTITAE